MIATCLDGQYGLRPCDDREGLVGCGSQCCFEGVYQTDLGSDPQNAVMIYDCVRPYSVPDGSNRYLGEYVEIELAYGGDTYVQTPASIGQPGSSAPWLYRAHSLYELDLWPDPTVWRSTLARGHVSGAYPHLGSNLAHRIIVGRAGGGQGTLVSQTCARFKCRPLNATPAGLWPGVVGSAVDRGFHFVRYEDEEGDYPSGRSQSRCEMVKAPPSWFNIPATIPTYCLPLYWHRGQYYASGGQFVPQTPPADIRFSVSGACNQTHPIFGPSLRHWLAVGAIKEIGIQPQFCFVMPLVLIPAASDGSAWVHETFQLSTTFVLQAGRDLVGNGPAAGVSAQYEDIFYFLTMAQMADDGAGNPQHLQYPYGSGWAIEGNEPSVLRVDSAQVL
ncbi:hypothetical protein RAS1_42350 [Phycisphaerae bacterium RAS1]|nr:hypothetical protein RAS1_42350 [Phycisphaerae bacterium RAS1]